MKFTEIEQYFSIPRVHRYLGIYSSKPRAIKLYRANMKLAKAFHPLLCITEVVVRNQIDKVLTLHFNDPNWIINQKTGFMSNPALEHGGYYLRREVESAEIKLTRRRVAISSSRIIAELNFKFWTDIFEPYHFGLLHRSPLNAFPRIPMGHLNGPIETRLTRIRKFRNRINHNEPIIFHGNQLDVLYPAKIRQDIMELLTWIDPKLIVWVAELDSIQKLLASCDRI